MKIIMRNALTGLLLALALPVLTGCGASRSTAALQKYPATEHADAGSAMLHFFRNNTVGKAVQYYVHIGTKPVYRSIYKSKASVRISLSEPQTITLWSKTEAREELTLTIEPGKEYYISCGVKMGAFVGRPVLEYVSEDDGKADFDWILWPKDYASNNLNLALLSEQQQQHIAEQQTEIAGARSQAPRQTYQTVQQQEEVSRPKWKASISGGGSYGIFNGDKTVEGAVEGQGVTTEQAKKYMKGLRTGWQGTAELIFLFGRFYGGGLRYNAFTVSSDLEGTPYGTLNEKNYVHYIAPTFMMRQTLGDKFAISWGVSIGYVNFKSELRLKYGGMTIEEPNITFKANTVGNGFEAAFEYFPRERLSLGVKTGYLNAIVRGGTYYTVYGKEKVDFEDDDAQSLARLDYSLCLSYYF